MKKRRKEKKLKTESRYVCMSLKCFHVSLINHTVSTSCVDIGVKLNAHIPKISTAPSHQRVYHSVLNIAGRKHRCIPSQKSVDILAKVGLRFDFANPSTSRPARNANFLTANRTQQS